MGVFLFGKHGIHKWIEVDERDNLAMGYGDCARNISTRPNGVCQYMHGSNDI